MSLLKILIPLDDGLIKFYLLAGNRCKKLNYPAVIMIDSTLINTYYLPKPYSRVEKDMSAR